MAIKAAYKLLYRSGLNFTQALKEIEQGELIPEVREIVDFFRSSKRGVMGAYYEEEQAVAESDNKSRQTQEPVKV
jgi:Udp N-acetylglucosamine O-acyltransferase